MVSPESRAHAKGRKKERKKKNGQPTGSSMMPASSLAAIPEQHTLYDWVVAFGGIPPWMAESNPDWALPVLEYLRDEPRGTNASTEETHNNHKVILHFAEGAVNASQ